MTFFAFSCFLTSILSLLLGVFVYFKDRKVLLNRIWFVMSSAVFLWSIGLFKVITSQNLKSAFFWQSILDISAIFIPVIFFHFILSFLNSVQLGKYRTQLFVAYFLTLTLSFISPFSLFKKGLAPIFEFNFWVVPGPFYFLFPLFFLIFAAYSFSLLVKNYPQIKEVKRYQLNYILLAALFGFGGGITNFLPQLIKVYPFGNFFVVLYLLFVILAITKYHLFEIRVILTELLVGAMGIILLVLPFLMPTISLRILTIAIFLFFCIFGYLLVRITHQEIRRRAEIEKLYEELKVLDKAKSEFVSMASHQLRTPLSAIKGYISMLVEGSYGEISGRAKEKLKNVFYSNERLIRIVNDLLNISKVELGKMELEKEPCHVEDLIDSCCQEMEIEAKKKNLKFIWKKPKISLPKINVDKSKIHQVVLNLIDNAIRYTQKGEIEIKAEKTNSKIQISVRDTGEGLTGEEKKRIFEGFTRGKAGIAYWIEGAGLGLYVAKKYLELHQGKIWAESEGKGKGSTFYIELPIGKK